MPAYSKLFDVLPDDYEYVMMVAYASGVVNFWMAANVARARKRLNVPYPMMYHPENKEFNCIQRAHQNTLEAFPGFLMMLTMGGLQSPKWAAGAGALYLLGRIIYARGYYTGEPEKRVPGGIICHAAELLLSGQIVCMITRRLGFFGSD